MQRCLLFSFILFLSACGFTPLYQAKPDEAQVRQYFDQIAIAVIPDQSGQFLRNLLLDRLYRAGEPDDPAYILAFTPIAEQIFNFDITVDSEATRRKLRLRTTMTLARNGRNVLQRRLMASTSFNVLESEFSTQVTERAAQKAALNDLARQVERELALYFSQKIIE